MLMQIIEQAHSIVGHYGDQRTAEYVQRWYWWPLIYQGVHEFCKTCEPCQRAKGSTKR